MEQDTLSVLNLALSTRKAQYIQTWNEAINSLFPFHCGEHYATKISVAWSVEFILDLWSSIFDKKLSQLEGPLEANEGTFELRLVCHKNTNLFLKNVISAREEFVLHTNAG